MGIDVWAESGIVVDLDCALFFVTKKNLKTVIQIAQEFFGEIKKASDENPDSEWRKQKAVFFQPLQQLEGKNLEEVQEVLRGLFTIEGEEYDAYLLYQEDLLELWEKIVDSFGPGLPSLLNIIYYSRYKVFGDMPAEEVCFVFDKKPCLDIKLTEAGRKLKKIVGHCQPSEWAVYSV